jgi:prolycopene isomerase
MKHAMLSINTNYNHDDNFEYALRGDYQRSPLLVTDHSQVDRSLVPQGKGSLLIITLDSYARWARLRQDEYKAEKLKTADILVRRAQEYLPGLGGNIEVIEAATPRTMQRYSESSEGAIYGFAQTVSQSGKNRLPQETPIQGLFLCGAWTIPGAGVFGCFISGLQAAELALRYLRR